MAPAMCRQVLASLGFLGACFLIGLSPGLPSCVMPASRHLFFCLGFWHISAAAARFVGKVYLGLWERESVFSGHPCVCGLQIGSVKHAPIIPTHEHFYGLFNVDGCLIK